MISKKKKTLLIVLLALLAVAAIVSAIVSRRQFRQNKTADIQAAYTLAESGKKDQAIKLLEDRYNADKSDKQVAKQLATYLFQNKNYDEFIKIADKAKLTDAQIYTMRAYIARSRGDTDNALKYYQDAIAANPRSQACYIDLTNYYQVLGQPDKALETVKQGLNYNPRSSTLNLMAASIAFSLGDKAGSKEYAKKVLEIDKDNASAKEIISKK